MKNKIRYDRLGLLLFIWGAVAAFSTETWLSCLGLGCGVIGCILYLSKIEDTNEK